MKEQVMLTPEQLRQRTLAANKGLSDQKALEKAMRIEKQFQDALKLFEENAAEDSLKGRHESVAFEVVLGDKQRSVNDLDHDTFAMFERLKKHFEGLGYTTRIHGPYTDGGPSHVYNGLDLLVGWPNQ